MSQADETVTTRPNRRRVFLAVSGPLFAAAPLASIRAMPVRTDVELLALGHDFDAAWTAERAVAVAEAGQDTHESDARTDAAIERTKAVVDGIESLDAGTLAGLKVKARAVSWCFDGQAIAKHCLDSPFTADRLAYQIVRDLLAMA